MGTLVCPLCCDEEFSNQLSLRYHLLSITDNVYCPECSQRFDSILQLADHLDGMCSKGEIESNSEEVASDMFMETMHKETEVLCDESNALLTKVNEEEPKQNVPVCPNSQLYDSESAVYLVPDVDVQVETSDAVIENEYVDIMEQKIDDTDDNETSRNPIETSVSEKYENIMHEAQDTVPESSTCLELNESEELESQESVGTPSLEISGISDDRTVIPDFEDRADGTREYSCSSCGITFSSVVEHIRMYHNGQEVVVEVPEVDKSVLDKLVRTSKEAIVSNSEQATDLNLMDSNDLKETPDVEDTNSDSFVTDYVEPQHQQTVVATEIQISEVNDTVVKDECSDNLKTYSWFKEKTRVVADEEKIKRIISDSKRILVSGLPAEELKYVSKEVKIGKFWESKPENEIPKESKTVCDNTDVPTLFSVVRKENKRQLLKKDTRTSIEKLFSGNFLLKGTGGRGTRPGPYLGVNRVPEVKVIMSPGDKGTENAISVFTCSTCKKEFGNVSAFERHSCTIAKTCTMVCKLCDSDISDTKAMRNHMEAVHNFKTEIPNMTKRKYKMQLLPKPVKCESCDMTFTTMRALKLHGKMHERSELKVPLECPVCHNICSSNRTLKQHMKVHTKPLPVRKSEVDASAEDEEMTVSVDKGGMLSLLVCKVCYKSFDNNEDLRSHWQEHSSKEDVEEVEVEKQVEQTDEVLKESVVTEEESVQYKKNTVPCVQCHKEIDKSCKEEHMAKHFSPMRYDCPICNKSFSKHGHLSMHLRIHRGIKEYSCIHCGKVFANMNLLRTHVQSHMVQRPYVCGFCGRGFFRPHDKVEHERIHTGEKPYSCSVCGMTFRVRYCLTLHMRRHTGIRPYNCKMCEKTFRTGTAFKAHTKIHLDERAYKCPFCPKKFNTLIQLTGHKNSHTKPYSCLECNRPFSSLYAVRKHMVSHEEGISGKDPLKFHCHVCGASYARRFALRDHLKTHGRNIPPAPMDKNCSDDSLSDTS